ncbi:hypothetical protein CF326_g3823 [Tilletia indica]|nr:hypothetical protein CF326_g3823 [Tilletia indica]
MVLDVPPTSPTPSSQAEESNTPELSQTSTLTSLPSDAETTASRSEQASVSESDVEGVPSPALEEFINDSSDLGQADDTEPDEGSSKSTPPPHRIISAHGPVMDSAQGCTDQPSASSHMLPALNGVVPGPVHLASSVASSPAVTSVPQGPSSAGNGVLRRSSRRPSARRNVFILSDSEDDPNDSDFNEDDDGTGSGSAGDEGAENLSEHDGDGIADEEAEQEPDHSSQGSDVSIPDFPIAADHPGDVDMEFEDHHEEDAAVEESDGVDSVSDEEVIEWTEGDSQVQMRQLANGERYFFQPLTRTWLPVRRLASGNRYNPVHLDDDETDDAAGPSDDRRKN